MKLLSNIKNRLIRLRHRKGHGVHSPYIYNIVREVFMNRSGEVENQELYKALAQLGCKKKQARELQNLFSHCGYSSFSIDCDRASSDVVICTNSFTIEQTMHCIAKAKANGSTVIILRSNGDSDRHELSRRVVAQHDSTTVDKSGYFLIFNNHLPKQHFIL